MPLIAPRAVAFDAARRRSLLTLGTASALVAAAPLVMPRGALAQSSPEDYVTMTLKAGAFTKRLAELAQGQGEAEPVKTFAELEIGEVAAIEEVLMSVAQAPAPELDPEQQQTLERMQGLSGAEFDKEFVQAQLTGHQKALEIQQPMAEMGEIDVPVATAKLAEESIKSHIAMLEMINQQIG